LLSQAGLGSLQNANGNPLLQVFQQLLQTQGGNMGSLLQSIQNNNTAFTNNSRMGNPYSSNMDHKSKDMNNKGSQDYKYDKKF
jgi:hypothetical protein